MFILRTLFVAWYVAMGFQVVAYSEQGFRADCPGHVTPAERWPSALVPVAVATWPAGLIISAMTANLPIRRVCDRFD
jgi:hypothetical protein